MTSKNVKKLKELFLDELVVFYLKEMTVASFDENGDQMKISGMTDGFVVDIDEDYFYVGDDEGNIEKAINREVIAIVEIAKVMPEVFKHISLPEDDEDFH